MIKNVWTVLCKRAIEDKRSNNVSLIENIEKLTITIPPEAPEEFTASLEYTLASLWHNADLNGDRSGTIRVSIEPPSGTETSSLEQNVSIKAGSFHKLYINLQGLGLTGPGWYFFILRIKEKESKRWKRAATIPLEVIYNVQEDAPMLPVS